MQQDEHVWAWRWQRFYRTGFMIGLMEIDGMRFIDPSDFFLAPTVVANEIGKERRETT